MKFQGFSSKKMDQFTKVHRFLRAPKVWTSLQ